jgi:hypothetical protein
MSQAASDKVRLIMLVIVIHPKEVSGEYPVARQTCHAIHVLFY